MFYFLIFIKGILFCIQYILSLLYSLYKSLIHILLLSILNNPYKNFISLIRLKRIHLNSQNSLNPSIQNTLHLLEIYYKANSNLEHIIFLHLIFRLVHFNNHLCISLLHQFVNNLALTNHQSLYTKDNF